MVTRLALTLLICGSLSAATYYVRTDGSDSNAGTADSSGGAWLTISKAASVVNAGDTVHVRAGTYQEYVTLTRSGTAGSPITWFGAAGLTTIIDPSIEITGSWSSAPEIGANVYKKSFATFWPRNLTADGYYVQGYWSTNRVSDLARATDSTMTFSAWSQPQQFWDGTEALWYYTNSVIFMRFRDNSDPATHAIRVSQNGTTIRQINAETSAVMIRASYNRLSGFTIRGALFPVAVQAVSGSLELTGNVIESNRVSQGYSQISLDGSLSLSSNVRSNIVRWNTVAWDSYETTEGAYGGAWKYNTASTWKNYKPYWTAKYRSYEGIEGGFEPALINGWRLGNGNVIHNNTASNGIHGVRLTWYPVNSPSTFSVGNTVASNWFSSLGGAAVMADLSRYDNTQIHDNRIADAAMGIVRAQSINHELLAGIPASYIFRNTAWNPPGIGELCYFHCDITYGGSKQPDIWWYHNSMEGGGSGYLTASAFNDELGSLNGIRFINNLASVPAPFDSRLRANAGLIDYNLLSGSWSGAADGGNNIFNSPLYEWGGSSASTSEPSWTLDDDSLAVDSGTNISGLGLPDTGASDALPDKGAIPYNPEPVLPQVSLSASATEVFERGAAITIYITRTGSTAGALTGSWTIGGTAGNGYQCSTIPGTWQIDSGQSTESVTLTPLDDGAYSGPLEFEITLTDEETYNVAGGPLVIRFIDSAINPVALRGPYFPGQGRPVR